ncbi:GyrI-like domain-containing protein [Pseudonocardia sp. DLS-67]
MGTDLVIEERAAQPYVAVRRTITVQTFPEVADRLPGVFGWLAERGVAPAGAPFFRYLVIDMERELDVEAGVPVTAPVDSDSDGDVLAGVLPAGRYATVTHTGHPDELIAVTGALLDEAAARGLTWDATETERGTRWGCRLELLLTNPAEQPDPSTWETELAFRLAD